MWSLGPCVVVGDAYVWSCWLAALYVGIAVPMWSLGLCVVVSDAYVFSCWFAALYVGFADPNARPGDSLVQYLRGLQLDLSHRFASLAATLDAIHAR